jgi:hypothetical protein
MPGARFPWCLASVRITIFSLYAFRVFEHTAQHTSDDRRQPETAKQKLREISRSQNVVGGDLPVVRSCTVSSDKQLPVDTA